MNVEVEAKFFCNHDDIKSKLQVLGAERVFQNRRMKRVVIHTDVMTKKNAFVRIRDEGYRATVTYKQFDSDTVDGAYESEIEVNNFDNAVHIFAQCGLEYDTYQESERENWQFEDTEIMLDRWPWLDDFIEIEAGSEKEVKDLAEKLGLNWQSAIFGGVANLYLKQYPHIGSSGVEEINHKWNIMRFSDLPLKLLSELKNFDKK